MDTVHRQHADIDIIIKNTFYKFCVSCCSDINVQDQCFFFDLALLLN